jgi:hypothetical protein
MIFGPAGSGAPRIFEAPSGAGAPRIFDTPPTGLPWDDIAGNWDDIAGNWDQTGDPA